jgi:carbon-monoxide dehydrogenase medium subunit
MFRLLRPFEFHEPASVEDAVALLSTYGDGARVLAGGTDLVVSMKKRELGPEHVIAISQLADLDFMELDADGSLRLGPLVTHAAIARSPIVREHFAMLATACNEVGTPQIRNMGTIGGNVCKAGPSQDTPPVLVALEAQLTLVGPLGERIIPLDQFCTGPFCTVMFADELLTQIRIPPIPQGGVGCYKWCTKITATDETLVGAAVVLVVDRDHVCRDVKIALSSVAPIATRVRGAEDILRGRRLTPELIEEAARMAASEARPRSRAEYRRRMVRVLVGDAVNELWLRSAGPAAGDGAGAAGGETA